MLKQKAIEHWELDTFIPNAGDLARHNDPEKIRLFGLDLLANGQFHAVSATEDRRMISGHMRLLAARSAGLKTLLTNVYPAALSDTQFRLIRLGENVHRTDLTPYQKWIACAELMCSNPGWKLLDLAEHLHLDPSSVTRLMSPSKCIPEWQDALKAEQVGIGDVYAASKLPASEQAALLALKLSGATRDQLEAARKKRQPAAVSAVKRGRVVCPLASGTKVTVTGAAMTLEGYIEALASALDAARKASRESLDVRTAEKVWKDRAKVKILRSHTETGEALQQAGEQS